MPIPDAIVPPDPEQIEVEKNHARQQLVIDTCNAVIRAALACDGRPCRCGAVIRIWEKLQEAK